MSKENVCLIGFTFILYILFDTLFFPWYQLEFFLLLAVHMFAVGLAISPLGSVCLRFFFGCRKIRTRKDKDYLLPLFLEVYEEASKENRHLNPNIRLYLDNDMSINAYAVGSDTIVVTKGAVNLLDKESLKGMIAHEFAHIDRGDTVLPLVLLVGNFWFFLVLIFIRLLKICFLLGKELMTDNEAEIDGKQVRVEHGQGAFLAKVFNAILDILVFSVSFLFMIILALNGRHSEFQADRYAYRLGYGKELIKALYDVREMELGHRWTVIERLKASHPDTDMRIERLEKMELQA